MSVDGIEGDEHDVLIEIARPIRRLIRNVLCGETVIVTAFQMCRCVVARMCERTCGVRGYCDRRSVLYMREGGRTDRREVEDEPCRIRTLWQIRNHAITGRHAIHDRVRRGYTLQERVMVAVDGKPLVTQAGGVDRALHRGEEAGNSGKPVESSRSVINATFRMPVEGIGIARTADALPHLRIATTGAHLAAIKQRPVPIDFVELRIIDMEAST
jgi:hypothetical protein